MILSEAFIEKSIIYLMNKYKLKPSKAFCIFNDIYAMITIEEKKATKLQDCENKE